MEHPFKLESDPVDPDQVGCASDASGTAVLGGKVNYKVVERYRFSTKRYLIDVDVKNRMVKNCICMFVIPYSVNKQSKKEENNYF